MNLNNLEANFSYSENSESEDLIASYFGTTDPIIDISEGHQFRAEVCEYQEEPFNMNTLLNGLDLVGGISPNPTYPDFLTIDLIGPLKQLGTYTNSLDVLGAPRELCVKKALELIEYRSLYKLALETFRLELTNQFMEGEGIEEVNALVKGVKCIADFLLANFDNHIQSNADFFPYEFYDLHFDRYLFLTKITFDASTPKFRPATVHLPARAYPSVETRPRADYIAQADYCIIL